MTLSKEGSSLGSDSIVLKIRIDTWLQIYLLCAIAGNKKTTCEAE